MIAYVSAVKLRFILKTTLRRLIPVTTIKHSPDLLRKPGNTELNSCQLTEDHEDLRKLRTQGYNPQTYTYTATQYTEDHQEGYQLNLQELQHREMNRH